MLIINLSRNNHHVLCKRPPRYYGPASPLSINFNENGNGGQGGRGNGGGRGRGHGGRGGITGSQNFDGPKVPSDRVGRRGQRGGFSGSRRF